MPWSSSWRVLAIVLAPPYICVEKCSKGASSKCQQILLYCDALCCNMKTTTTTRSTRVWHFVHYWRWWCSSCCSPFKSVCVCVCVWVVITYILMLNAKSLLLLLKSNYNYYFIFVVAAASTAALVVLDVEQNAVVVAHTYWCLAGYNCCSCYFCCCSKGNECNYADQIEINRFFLFFLLCFFMLFFGMRAQL